MRVLVIGGTGAVGSQLISQLVALSNPPTIRASTRSPTTANFPPTVESVAADLSDPSTFPPLFAGVDGAFLYTTSNGAYSELATAAKAAGVQRLVLLSSNSVVDEPDSKIGAYHKRAEELIRASGVHYTFIRAGFFHSNFHKFVDPQLQLNSGGVIQLPYPEALIAPVAEEDLAAVALTALTTDSLLDVAELVTGAQVVDFTTELAAISKVREAAGKPPLIVRQVSEAEWVSKYTNVLQQVPPSLVKLLAQRWGEMVGKQPKVSGSERLTDKPGTTVEQWVESRKEEWVNAGEK